MKEFWLLLQDFLFPQRCLCCGAVIDQQARISFCSICRSNVRLLCKPCCRICGRPFAKSGGGCHRCAECLRKRWFFSRARSAVYYREPIIEAVKKFKYNSTRYPLETFAALTEEYFRDNSMPEADSVIPVPLHPERLRKRGFNQALVLCRKLFPHHKSIIEPLVLERHRWQKTQAGLSGAERIRNVKNSFRVKRPSRIRQRKILLVDDVFTTGATVNECSRVLLESGAEEVEVFTFARVAYRDWQVSMSGLKKT